MEIAIGDDHRVIENGQYAYGAALALVLVIIGAIAALFMWRFLDMNRLLQHPHRSALVVRSRGVV